MNVEPAGLTNKNVLSFFYKTVNRNRRLFPMNAKRLTFRSLLAATSLFAILLAVPASATAQSIGTFYYWVAPGSLYRPPTSPPQSFVIEVDSAQAAQIEAIFSEGGRPGLGGRIAAGSVDYNKDYYSPDHRVWNWHFIEEGIFDFNKTLFPACECPSLIANPSEIAANPAEWIRQNGNVYTPVRYQIIRRIDPSQRTSVANVSNRGLTGAGERTLIAGLIIKGGEPRNIVLRALGPSLSSSGIQQIAGNPRLVVHKEGTAIAGNLDWNEDSRAAELNEKYPTLTPTNDKEAALLLTLLPGAYTLQGINEDGTEGVVLLEAFDVDSALP